MTNGSDRVSAALDNPPIELPEIVEMLERLEADVTQALSMHAPHAAQAFFQQFGEIRKALVGIDLRAARAAMNGGDSDLDQAADALLARFAKFFAECVTDPAFCAMSVDERRDSSSKLQYIRFVPCDLKGTEPERRWPKD